MLLEEFIKPLGITQSEFAVRLGISFPRLNEIVRCKRSVTPDTALRLARVLGMPADFWLGLQLDWDLWHAMQTDEANEIAQLEPLQLSMKRRPTTAPRRRRARTAVDGPVRPAAPAAPDAERSAHPK
jgi:addiction module HigA family antidote